MRPSLSVLLCSGLLALACSGARGDEAGQLMPPLPQKPKVWIGTPQSWEGLRGQVVLVDVWAFRCANCLASMPWIKEVRERYGPRGLSVVGVHTPELEEERDAGNVRRAVQKYGLDYPHLLDMNSAYWDALHNKYWPTVYLVDRCGRRRGAHVGEVHSKGETAVAIEARIEALLDEKSCQS